MDWQLIPIFIAFLAFYICQLLSMQPSSKSAALKPVTLLALSAVKATRIEVNQQDEKFLVRKIL